MLIDDPAVSGAIFYPRRTSTRPTLEVDVPGARLGCFLHRRYPDAGVLLSFHGNGETASENSEYLAESFLALGVNVCFAEYRGYGASTGAPALGAMLGDGEAIAGALGIPPERIVAFGRSLGSIYAVELARRLPNLAGLILESGIADAVELLKPRLAAAQLPCSHAELFDEVRNVFDAHSVLACYQGSLLVLHAVKDRLVERSHGERLHAWAGSRYKKLTLFAEGDHNSILFANSPQYLAEVGEFLSRAGITASGKPD